MSRFRNEVAHLNAHVKTLRLGVCILFVLLLVMSAGWWSAPRELTIHVPPDLRSGSTRKWWEVPPESVYAFTFYIFQQLHRWPTNGEEDYLRLKLAGEPNELFGLLLLDGANKIIGYENLFTGSVSQTSVYPRVIVQRALARNASAVILVHNHPSGFTTPSHTDKVLTRRVQEALALIEVTVLDHFIVGKGEPFSFAETGLL